MGRVAAALARKTPGRVPPLLLLSDSERTPDLDALADRMPAGSGLIYRARPGEHDLEQARRLRAITASRDVILLVGADAGLAEAVGADGIHLPRGSTDAPGLRRARPSWIITQAAPKTGVWPDGRGVDAYLLSSVFGSDSPSAGTPLGVAAFSSRVARAPRPVFALGGVTAETAPALTGSGAAGIASIGGLADELRRHAMQSAAHTPNKGQGPMTAESRSSVSITKDEGGELITYTASVAGESATGELTLRRVADGVWNANHTGVPNAIGGRGVGKALVQAMVEDARAQGWRIVPGCPFVAKLFERRPEWADGIT